MFVPLNHLRKILKIDETSMTGLRWRKIKNDKLGWNKRYAGKKAGSLKRSGKGVPSYKITITFNGVSKIYIAHRIIYYIYHGKLNPNKVIDHKNNNPLDNRIRNLRECTHAQNCLNRRISRNNKVGAKNISKLKNGLYNVVFYKNGKIIFTKKFSNKKTAKSVAAKKRKKYHGFFANNKKCSIEISKK